MANDVVNFFICFLATRISFDGNSFHVFADVLNGPFAFPLLCLRIRSVF